MIKKRHRVVNIQGDKKAFRILSSKSKTINKNYVKRGGIHL